MIVGMLELAAGPCRVLLDLEAGGRLASWRVSGLELLEPRNDGNHPFGWGSYPMVPWAGRLRRGRFSFDGTDYELPLNFFDQHAIHGTAYDATWLHLSGGTDWAMLGLRLGDPWPFGGTVTHLLHLTASTLTQTLTVAAGDRDLPASLGWHPWFRRRLERGRQLQLDADVSNARMLVRDDDYIPTGRLVDVPPRPWDDCFVGVGPIRLTWPGALHVDVEHDCSHVVMYDPPHAICVEPQSGPPDAFTLAPVASRVPAGGILEQTVTWRWSMASAPS
jgi:aldose 1-epimerase